MWAELKAARDEYLTFYRKLIRHHRKEHPSLATELLMELNGLDDRPPLYRLYRFDFVWKERGGQVRVGECNLNPIGELAPLRTLRAGSLEVTAYPLVWNAVEVRFSPRRRTWLGVEEWYRRWLDIEDGRPTDRHGLAGVVHNAGRPEREGGRMSFCIDFGSAPLDAFDELLAALGDAGVTDVEVGSFSFTTANEGA
jgi:hypothetical protein